MYYIYRRARLSHISAHSLSPFHLYASHTSDRQTPSQKNTRLLLQVNLIKVYDITLTVSISKLHTQEHSNMDKPSNVHWWESRRDRHPSIRLRSTCTKWAKASCWDVHHAYIMDGHTSTPYVCMSTRDHWFILSYSNLELQRPSKIAVRLSKICVARFARVPHIVLYSHFAYISLCPRYMYTEYIYGAKAQTDGRAHF